MHQHLDRLPVDAQADVPAVVPVSERGPQQTAAQMLLGLQRAAGNRAARTAARRPTSGTTTTGAGTVVVQRDLLGSASVLSDISAGTVRRATMSRWAKLIEALNRFEAAEVRLRNRQRSRQRVRNADLDDLLQRLQAVKVQARRWRHSNEDDAIEERREYVDQFAIIRNNRDRNGDAPVEEEGKKAQQLGALNMLETRIAFEERVLTDRSWLRLGSFSDVNVSGVEDNAVGGALNRLDRGQWTGTGGDVTRGFFGKDKHVDPTIDTSPGTQIGIGAYDPNYSGRSVAMAQIDKLITDKIKEVALLSEPRMLIDMQFATHTRETAPQSGQFETVMGVVGEQAQGEELRSGHLAGGNTRLGGAGQGLALDDPTLQRGMNKLQLLDAICGQVDRHMANIFIDTDDDGGVTRVTGIDNDLAFGQNWDSVDRRDNRVFGGGSWRGLPPIADRATALAIRAITPQMIRDALSGLLQPQEIEGTVSRFLQVRNFLLQLPEEKLISHDQWVQQRQQLAKQQTSEDSYLGVARDELLTNWKKANGQRLAASVRQRIITSLTTSFIVDEDAKDLPPYMGDVMSGWVSDLTLVAVSQLKVQLPQVETKCHDLTAAFLQRLDDKNLKKNFMQSQRGYKSDARQFIEKELPQVAEQLFI